MGNRVKMGAPRNLSNIWETTNIRHDVNPQQRSKFNKQIRKRKSILALRKNKNDKTERDER